MANAESAGVCELFYWRERNREVDFVVRAGKTLVAIEVKNGRSLDALPGLGVFVETFEPPHTLLVGAAGIPPDEFLGRPAENRLK